MPSRFVLTSRVCKPVRGTCHTPNISGLTQPWLKYQLQLQSEYHKTYEDPNVRVSCVQLCWDCAGWAASSPRPTTLSPVAQGPQANTP